MGLGREAKERSVGEQAAEQRSPQVLAVPLLLLLFRMFAESLRQPRGPFWESWGDVCEPDG